MRIINLSGRLVVVQLDALMSRMTEDNLCQLRQLNPDLKIEHTSDGRINITTQASEIIRKRSSRLKTGRTE